MKNIKLLTAIVLLASQLSLPSRAFAAEVTPCAMLTAAGTTMAGTAVGASAIALFSAVPKPTPRDYRNFMIGGAIVGLATAGVVYLAVCPHWDRRINQQPEKASSNGSRVELANPSGSATQCNRSRGAL